MTTVAQQRSIADSDAAPARHRISEIDTAKGIGIALVVFGHMVARDAKPAGNEWWLVWHDHLYSFHMAFFFFLSGYVFFLEPVQKWAARLRKTASKLVPAYLLFALVVYVAKAAAVRLLHVDRPVRNPLEEMVLMLAYPTEGFAQFLWFIVTLLMIMAVVTMLRRWMESHFGVVFAVGLALHALSVAGFVTELLAMHQLARYAVFFLLGSVCHRHSLAWATAVSRYGVLWIIAFAVALIVLPEPWLLTIAAFLSVPGLVALARWCERCPSLRRVLQFLGRNTLTIYLMNSLAMGLVRAVVLKTWGWDGWHFFAVVPLLLLSGLLLPIAVQRLVFARWSWSDRITR